jgi:GntR family transcriptional regulator of arabinose operon
MNEAKYLSLVSWIKKDITQKNYKSGDRFYTEGELAAMFGVSRLTVRQAVGILAADHVLERRKGSGTYIASGTVKPPPGRSRTVGVIFCYIDNYIFPMILHGIERVLAQHGYAMQLAFTLSQYERERKALQMMIQKNVDGIILVPARSAVYSPNLPLLLRIKECGIPLIQLTAALRDAPFPCVTLDDAAAGKIATERLIRAGHRRIAGLFMSDVTQGTLRYEGYVKALREADLEMDNSRVIWFTQEEAVTLFTASSRLADRLSGCTGLFCLNDYYAVCTMKLLMEKGIRVPDDLSVVGVDNLDLAGYSRVPLTSVDHPKETAGERTAERIIRLMNDPDYDAALTFPPVLTEGESVLDIGAEHARLA